MLFVSGAFLQKHLAKHTVRPFPGLSQPPLTVMMVIFIKANRKSSISWISCAASTAKDERFISACTVMVSWYHPNCWLQNVRRCEATNKIQQLHEVTAAKFSSPQPSSTQPPALPAGYHPRCFSALHSGWAISGPDPLPAISNSLVGEFLI